MLRDFDFTTTRRLGLIFTVATPLMLSACDKDDNSDDPFGGTTWTSTGGMEAMESGAPADTGTPPDATGMSGSGGGEDAESMNPMEGGENEQDTANDQGGETSGADPMDGSDSMNNTSAEEGPVESAGGDEMGGDEGMGEEAGGDEMGGDDGMEAMGPCSMYPDGGLKTASVGAQAPHYETIDSHNETFNMCDFAGDRPILVDLSAGWCGPCQGFANYIATGNGDYPPVKPAVDGDRIYLIEYLIDDQTNDGVVSDPPGFLKAWHDAFPHPKVIVAHGRRDLPIIFAQGGSIALPSFGLIGLDYKWEAVGSNSLNVAASK